MGYQNLKCLASTVPEIKEGSQNLNVGHVTRLFTLLYLICIFFVAAPYPLYAHKS